MPTIITRGAVSAKAYGFGVSSSSYTIKQSLRFRAAASAYLNRTPSVAGNRQRWTYSVWVKRGILTTNCYLIQSNVNSSAGLTIDFDTDRLSYGINGVGNWFTTAVFRDPSAWYHIVIAFDSTQATAANRLIAYVNNVSYSFSANSIVQNNSYDINNNTIHYIGRSNSGDYFDGYMAEAYMVDGQQLTPSSFGAYDSNGVWQPIKYGGSYGTNGFYLNFGNTTSTTTLGYDTSGNSNNWTTNNFSLTAGSTYDSMTDSPTVTSTSVANYAVLNPLNTGGTLSSGNLGGTGSGFSGQAGTIAMSSGKWYWEVTNIYNMAGLALSTWKASGGVGGVDSWGYITNGNKINNSSQTSYGATYSNTDVIGVAFDANAGTLTFYKNNVSQGTAFSGLTSGPYVPAIGYQNTSGNITYINFGQQPFTYTPPTGFNALNTYNLPTPTIANGALYMAATTYAGNSSTQSISDGGNNTIGTTFQPDFAWIKNRGSAASYILVDSVRGSTNVLVGNTNTAESSQPNYVTSFNSTGFSLGNGSGGAVVDINQSGQSYIGWQWQANKGTNVSNTNGSITSTVSANTTAGFSVVTWGGNGTNPSTVGHGLGVAPSMIINKRRDQTGNWIVYHSSVGNTGYLVLNSTAATTTSSAAFNNTSPTSSVFTVGYINPDINTNGSSMVAYCWAAVPGYSAFGSYTGNNSTDGPFVYCGFRPRWVMIKLTSGSGQWTVFDTSRNTYNVTNTSLFPNDGNSGDITDANRAIDVLSNGFKLRSNSSATNDINAPAPYIYAAFAENPLNYSRAR